MSTLVHDEVLVPGDLARFGARTVRVAAAYPHGDGRVEITATDGRVWDVPAAAIHRVTDQQGALLPPLGAEVLLHPSAAHWIGYARRFRVIVARHGATAGVAVLRGWYLDGPTITEQQIEVDLAGVEVVSES